MKQLITISILMLITLGAATAGAADIERTGRIEKSFRVPGHTSDMLVVVDNVFGSIDVTGYDGDEVQLIVRKTIEARSQKKADLALTQKKVYQTDVETAVMLEDPTPESVSVI